jgi:hypothetical protein
MKATKNDAKIDPVLLEQLEQAQSSGDAVEAVFTLRPADASQPVPDPEQTLATVDDLLARVEEETGQAPQAHNVFEYFGSFVVRASPLFIADLLEQDEIASATANRQPGSALIDPRNKRPA